MNDILKCGFSLIEVVIAMSLALALGVGVSQFVSFTIKSEKRVRQNSEFTAVADTIGGLLNDPLFCHTHLYNGITPATTAYFNPVTPLPSGLQLTEVRVGPNTLAKKGDSIGNLEQIGLNLTEADVTRRTVLGGSTKYLAKLTLSATVGRNEMATTANRDYYLNITTTNAAGVTQDQITSCSLISTALGPGTPSSVRFQMCTNAQSTVGNAAAVAECVAAAANGGLGTTVGAIRARALNCQHPLVAELFALDIHWIPSRWKNRGTDSVIRDCPDGSVLVGSW